MVKRTKTFELRLAQREYDTWAAKAKDTGVTISEWKRQRCRSVGRPKDQPRKPVAPKPEFPPCVPGVTDAEPCELCDHEKKVMLAEYDERMAKEQQERQEQERRNWAVSQSKADGSVENWFASLPSRVAAEREPPRGYLLDVEKAAAEQDRWWRAHNVLDLSEDPPSAESKSPETTSASKPSPAWRPPPTPSGILDFDLIVDPDLSALESHLAKARICSRERQQEPQTISDDGAAFD